MTALVKGSTQNVCMCVSYSMKVKLGKTFPNFFCAERAMKIVSLPKEMLDSFSIVCFLNNYDVMKRKQKNFVILWYVWKARF